MSSIEMHIVNGTDYFNNINNFNNDILIFGFILLICGTSCKCFEICYSSCKKSCKEYEKKKKRKKIETLTDNLLPTSSAICCICLEDFSNSDKKVNKLPCHHIFHKKCIREWLKNNETCPECRCKI